MYQRMSAIMHKETYAVKVIVTVRNPPEGTPKGTKAIYQVIGNDLYPYWLNEEDIDDEYEILMVHES